MAEIDSQKYFHVSHPPLFHYILALAFALLGGSELVARIVILPFSLGSVALVYLLAERYLSRRIAVTASLFMALSVLSSYFGRIVNFEVLAQFFVLLFIFQYLRYPEQRTRLDLALLITVLILAPCVRVVVAPPGDDRMTGATLTTIGVPEITTQLS